MNRAARPFLVMLSAAKHLRAPRKILRCAQDDTRGSSARPFLVMLSAAKHPGAPRDRHFAEFTLGAANVLMATRLGNVR